MGTLRTRPLWSSARRERPLALALGWRPPSWLLDIGPVAFIVLIGCAGIATVHRPHPGRIDLALALAVSAVALIARHRAPLAALAAIVLATLAVGYGPVVTLPLLVAVFTVAEYADRRRIPMAALLAAASVAAAQALHGPLTAPRILSDLIAIGLALAVGLYVRARADYIAGLRERAERLERERELLAQRAVAEERVRIARELHDVVAHSVSLMVVQAQAAAATADEDQRRALRQVADLGRGALSEMHRMLGLLRVTGGGDPELAPQPGVGDIPALVRRTQAAGLQVQLTVTGAQRPLPAGVDLSAYRIVQEALTNSIRHGRAGHAHVTLTYLPDAFEVTVHDDGAGPADGPAGHGLIGMRERVALFGGELQTGRRDDGGGYRVRALIPLR
ncbi:MAG TPA: histidine kinase [Solirubrobacteraceae bacterium]|nr:histidine kinase [Solirubrobacteraceae bacterium]